MKRLLCGAVLGVLALAGCGEAEAGLPEPARPSVAAEDAVLLVVPDPESGFAQHGLAHVDVTTVSLDGGTVVSRRVDGRLAMRFPAFSADPQDAPRSVLAVHNRTSYDAMSPGTRDFTWSAEVYLNGRSSDESEGSVDNGDNVLQRGLATDRAQFKLELDNRRPTCAIVGSLGKVRVRSAKEVVPRAWYRVTCVRFADSVAISVLRLDGDRAAATRRRTGPIGTVRFDSATIPLSIGGKLDRDGRVVAQATDQFNGAVRRPRLAIEGRR